MKLISFLFTFAAALGFASALSEALRGSMEDRAEQRTFRVLRDKIQKAANNGILLQDGAADHTKPLGGGDCDEKIPKEKAQLKSIAGECFEWGTCPDDDAEALKKLVVSVLI